MSPGLFSQTWTGGTPLCPSNTTWVNYATTKYCHIDVTNGAKKTGGMITHTTVAGLLTACFKNYEWSLHSPFCYLHILIAFFTVNFSKHYMILNRQSLINMENLIQCIVSVQQSLCRLHAEIIFKCWSFHSAYLLNFNCFFPAGQWSTSSILHTWFHLSAGKSNKLATVFSQP